MINQYQMEKSIFSLTFCLDHKNFVKIDATDTFLVSIDSSENTRCVGNYLPIAIFNPRGAVVSFVT